MRKVKESGQPLFDFLDIHVSELDKHSGAIQAMLFDRSFQGMIVRGVIPQATVDRVNERLASDYGGIERYSYPGQVVDKAFYTLGLTITNSHPDLREYFIHAAAFRESCRSLFADDPDFETKIESIFQQLSGNLPAKVPTGPNGETYTPATVRVMLEGAEIGIHVGMEFLNLIQANHLKTLIDLTNQLSYFIPLSIPEAGGELIVYAIEYADIAPFMPKTMDNSYGKVYREGTKVFELVDQYASMTFAPRPGDMVIFDGGRYYHRISSAVGQCPRRTIGGFLTLSKDRDEVYYWA